MCLVGTECGYVPCPGQDCEIIMVTQQFIDTLMVHLIQQFHLADMDEARFRASVAAWTKDFLDPEQFTQRGVQTVMTNIATARLRGVV